MVDKSYFRKLEEFCKTTSLHGYSYLLHSESLLVKIFWVFVIVTMTCFGAMFLVTNTKTYLDSKLVITLESSSVPLKEAVFPSLTVCNFNQLEASYLKELGIYGIVDRVILLEKEYITGRTEKLTNEELIELEMLQMILSNDPVYDGRQRCKNLFISIHFQGIKISWQDFLNGSHIEPRFYGTDYGSCCYFIPHELTTEIIDWEDYHILNASAKQGEEKGLTVVFDIEQFNYGYTRGEGAGLHLSLNDHRDKPMMQFSSQLIQVGKETQVIVKPVLSYTTKDAIDAFSPEERDCYEEDEVTLQLLNWNSGFRYEMNNCLIDQGIQRVYWNCSCYPLITAYADEIWNQLEPCSGEKLHCANEILKQIGSQAYINQTSDIENSEKIGNMTRKSHIQCRPACQIQENEVTLSQSTYPSYTTFFYKNSFCHVASHVWQITCSSKNRKYFLDLHYPNLCQVLQDFEQVFGPQTSCKNWPVNYFNQNKNGINQTLLNEMLAYAKDNLALVKIYFQSPYLTKIKRDVKMPFIDFVANTGGLLGLYLGFSIISLIEIIYWCCSCINCKGFRQ